MTETVSGAMARAEAAHARIEGHEELCAERYKNIHGRLDLLFAVLGAAALIGVGCGGWAFSKVWDAQQQQVAAIQQIVARR